MKKRKFQDGGYTALPAPTSTSSPVPTVNDSPYAGVKGYASPELPQMPVGAPTPAPVVSGRPTGPITPQFNALYGQGEGNVASSPRRVGVPSAPSAQAIASMRALLNPRAARPRTENAGGRQMPAPPRSRVPIPAKGRPAMAEGGEVNSYAKGGSVRGGGCEQRGKTKGRFV